MPKAKHDRYAQAVARNIESAKHLCIPEMRARFAGSILDTVRTLVPRRLYARLGIRDADRNLYRQAAAEVQAMQWAAALLYRLPSMYKENPKGFREWLEITWFREQEGSARMSWVRLYENGLWLMDPANSKSFIAMNVMDFQEPTPSEAHRFLLQE